MTAATATYPTPTSNKSLLDRALSVFTDVRAGEGATAVLMLVNICLLLVCYSVIKTVREPLILLGGGAEVRLYAAAGQAILLMGFVPLYSWFTARVNRKQLLVGVTLFFLVCIELFSMAVAARVPFVGVAFFIWVGIFNVSLVAQFWSFANDVYTKEAGDRLFPIIVIGMTAGAPFGSFVAARLFRSGVTPQVILQVSAALLAASVLLYLRINGRVETREQAPAPVLSATNGFRLVLASPYLRLVALLIVLLNLVNTTGEYMVARMLTAHVKELAALDPNFNKQAFIGAFSGDYQFWVNVSAFVLQAFVASRLVKFQGLRGVLLALPLIAFGGYAVVAAGVGFSVVRWIKTAENATDYSIMNTARQLLWLPTSRDEKYKAKQAIDAFFVRGGDVFSAAAVYVGASIMHLNVQQFAIGNVVLTLAWLGVAAMILKPRASMPRLALRPLAYAAVILAIIATATPVFAQDTREEQIATMQAEKATRVHPYEPDPLEKKLDRVNGALNVLQGPVYPFIGSAFEGGGFAFGPGVRARIGDTGSFDAHAAYSLKSYKSATATYRMPTFAAGRIQVEVRANWIDAPDVAFYGTGIDSRTEDRAGFFYKTTTIGATTRFQATKLFAVGAGIDSITTETGAATAKSAIASANPSFARTRVFAEIDTRTSPAYTRSGGLYRVDFSDYRQTNSGPYSFQRVDAEVRQFVPLMRENWVLALRAMASSTMTDAGDQVPFFMLPELGGSHWLRGYPAFRFRDRDRVLVSGEYRWTAGSFVDMALFLDAGTTAARFSQLDAQNFKKSYGLGISFHTPTATVTRIELARTHEGNALVFSVSPSF